MNNLTSNKQLIAQKFKIEWATLCNQNYQRMGDTGTCVLGASVKIAGHEIPAWDVCKAQGSLVWESGLDALIQRYRDEYKVDVYYNPGMMD